MGTRRSKKSKTVSIPEAARQLLELLAIVRRGEEVVIAQEDEPVARLIPIPSRKRQRPRRFGGYEGKIRMAEDFDAPLPYKFWVAESSA